MTIDAIPLARKYATAFLNVFIDTISIQDYCALEALKTFLTEHADLIAILKLNVISREKKIQYIEMLFEQSGLPASSYKKLVALLADDQRLYLIVDVVKQIELLYRMRRNIEEFAIHSSHKLAKEQLEQIKNFLSQKINKHIIYKYQYNKRLIAGIRLQSDVLLWEYSIARQLRDLQRIAKS